MFRPKVILLKAICSLPIFISARLLTKYFGKNWLSPLQENNLFFTSIRIHSWLIYNTYRKRTSGPTIFIGGTARVGKSILASLISNELNYGLVSLDTCRALWNHKNLSQNERLKIKKNFLNLLSQNKKFGLIVEGDELITNDSHISHPTEGLKKINIEFLKSVNNRTNIIISLLGTSQVSQSDKFNSIRKHAKEHECWTSELKINEILNISNNLIIMSNNLKLEADKAGLVYFDINPSQFESNITNVANYLKNMTISRSKN